MEDNNAPSHAPMPCTAGCGFYGSKIYDNMCSKCFKEEEARNKKDVEPLQKIPEANPVAAKPTELPCDNVVITPSEHPEQDPKEDVEEKLQQKNKARCFICPSKIPIAKQLINKCRCEYVFCDKHRLPEIHQCSFDHAAMDKDILSKNNPKLNERPRGGRSFQRMDSM